jgi:excinuclease UvrABC nuclease subunit
MAIDTQQPPNRPDTAEKSPARAKLGDLPDSSGVYLYRDRKGRLLYVGKANSLRNRVRSYFQAGGHEEARTGALVSEIWDLDAAAEALRFGEAAALRDRIRYLKKALVFATA